MNKEIDDLHVCGLEMKGGYHGHPYPQKFVKAPLSKHPSKAPSSGKEKPHSKAMHITMKG